MPLFTLEQVRAAVEADRANRAVKESLTTVRHPDIHDNNSVQAKPVDHIADADKMVPSDAELAALWYESSGSADTEHTAVDFARALLSRYAQAAASAELPKISDHEIEILVEGLGMRWNGDYWVCEDADLHPMARALLYRYTEASVAAPVAQEPVAQNICLPVDLVSAAEEALFVFTTALSVDKDNHLGFSQQEAENAKSARWGLVRALASPVAAQPKDMVSVKKQDANNYCRILTILEMEEEGDPVAEVERLVAAQLSVLDDRIFDDWWDELVDTYVGPNKPGAGNRSWAFLGFRLGWNFFRKSAPTQPAVEQPSAQDFKGLLAAIRYELGLVGADGETILSNGARRTLRWADAQISKALHPDTDAARKEQP